MAPGGRVRRVVGLIVACLSAAARAGYVLRAAFHINNRGQVVGAASIRGHGHGYLLSPVRGRR
jgi:hypothetical protein